MIDPLTAGKTELEEHDRVRSLAAAARSHLQKFLFDWADGPREDVISELLDIMSWGEAHAALEYIEWEDADAARTSR